MSADLRRRIVDVLGEAAPRILWCPSPGCPCEQSRERVADALLPLFDAHATERAANELTEAADDITFGVHARVAGRVGPGAPAVRADAARQLRDRAAALTEKGTDQ